MSVTSEAGISFIRTGTDSETETESKTGAKSWTRGWDWRTLITRFATFWASC